MADPVSWIVMAGGLALGAAQYGAARSARKEQQEAIEEAKEAHYEQIDIAEAHAETQATEMHEYATETMEQTRGQIEARLSVMGGRGRRGAAALEGAISETERDWRAAIDRELQFIKDDLEAKREVVGAEASLADISSRIAYTQNIFQSFQTAMEGLFTGLKGWEPKVPKTTTTTEPQAGGYASAYEPPVYTG